MSNPNADSQSSPTAWLFGPIPDLLLGCGGVYFVGWFVLSTFATGLLSESPPTMKPLLILVFSIPHYGATLLRVYDQREDRRTYLFFALWVSLALVAAFGLALYSFVFACWMVTLYLTWSPWHYSGQNFGIAVLLLRRQGVAVEGTSRSLLHASFILSFVLTMLVIHTRAAGMADYQIDAALTEGIHFLAIGIPEPFADIATPIVAAAWGISTLAAVGLLLRRATLRALVPLFSILVLQSLWFTIPYGLGYFRISTGLPVIDLGVRQEFFTYVAITHAIQYLWITTYFARASASWKSYGRYWLKALLFGQAVAILPIVLVAKLGLGGLSYDAGLVLLVVAFMNLHHFVLDGAIWKLRGGRIAQVLLRAGRDNVPPIASSWPRRVAWTLASGVFVVGLMTHFDRYYVFGPAIERRAPADAQVALDRLEWFGHEGGSDRLRLSILYGDEGDNVRAEVAVRRSLELRPMTEGFGVLGALRSRAGDWDAARAAYGRGLELAPDDPRLLRGAGVAAYRLSDWETAEAYLRSAVEKGRNDAETTRLLSEARDRLRERRAGE